MEEYFMKSITNDWLQSAEGDLQLIKSIINQEELTHLSAFHAQQAIEKTFKAIIEEHELGFLKTHSLETLYNKVKSFITIVDFDMLIVLDQLYIDARYPGEFGLLPHGKPSLKEAMEFYDFADEIFASSQKILL